MPTDQPMMKTIKILSPTGQEADYEREQLSSLWHQGVLQLETQYWDPGSLGWRPISECFRPASQKSEAVENNEFERPTDSPGSLSDSSEIKAKTSKRSSGIGFNILGVLVAVIAGAVGRECTKAVTGSRRPSYHGASSLSAGSASKESDAEELLANVASQVRKSLPMKVDADTRLDSVDTGPGKVITYNYTLLTSKKSELDVPRFRSALEDKLTREYRTLDKMKVFRDLGVIMKYEYRDWTGQFVTRITVMP